MADFSWLTRRCCCSFRSSEFSRRPISILIATSQPWSSLAEQYAMTISGSCWSLSLRQASLYSAHQGHRYRLEWRRGARRADLGFCWCALRRNLWASSCSYCQGQRSYLASSLRQMQRCEITAQRLGKKLSDFWWGQRVGRSESLIKWNSAP